MELRHPLLSPGILISCLVAVATFVGVYLSHDATKFAQRDEIVRRLESEIKVLNNALSIRSAELLSLQEENQSHDQNIESLLEELNVAKSVATDLERQTSRLELLVNYFLVYDADEPSISEQIGVDSGALLVWEANLEMRHQSRDSELAFRIGDKFLSLANGSSEVVMVDGDLCVFEITSIWLEERVDQETKHHGTELLAQCWKAR